VAKAPSSLAPFSYNWVGGDIRGLSRLAGTLYGFADQAAEPANTLQGTVDRLVSESGDNAWKGSAADNFKMDFGQDIVDVRWMNGRTVAVGDAVDGLAVTLAKIESWLESQAEQGVRAGYVTLDGAGKMTLPKGTSDPRVQRFLQQFNQSREQALIAAKAARKVAAKKLAAEYSTLSNGLMNYKTNHRNLLSKNELAALDSNLRQLRQGFQDANHLLDSTSRPGAHEKALLKDAVMTATTIIGGTAGAVVGTFVEPGGGTIAGAGIGGLIGQGAGSMLGSIFD
jgi:hypothetical protein